MGKGRSEGGDELSLFIISSGIHHHASELGEMFSNV